MSSRCYHCYVLPLALSYRRVGPTRLPVNVCAVPPFAHCPVVPCRSPPLLAYLSICLPLPALTPTALEARPRTSASPFPCRCYYLQAMSGVCLSSSQTYISCQHCIQSGVAKRKVRIQFQLHVLQVASITPLRRTISSNDRMVDLSGDAIPAQQSCIKTKKIKVEKEDVEI
ncbi:hypothetical protein Taro_046326 [Colocasia esculenta]|uniref:Uncharacterized protein n=1 Tax=Colocasia esculenta TaxID=4460 RepID=A0A843X3Z7_COLES|nr:hypothetical protein [Colocasia esculenta]